VTGQLVYSDWGDAGPDARLSIPLEDVDFTFVDVETTGLRPYLGDRICEIAVLRRRAREVVGSFHSLVNPGCPISPGASAVNGISDQDVADAPSFERIIGKVAPLLEGAVLVAHNAPFDMGFLSSHWQLAGASPLENLAVDTLTLARRHLPFRRHSLGYLIQALGIPVHGRHRAMADVEATVGLFDHLIRVIRQRGVRTLKDLLAAQGGPIPWKHMEVPALPPDLAEALTGKGAVWIRYESSVGRLTERVVRPIRVAPGPGDMLYLEAHCHLRGELRFFRVDRIVQLRPADVDEIDLDCQATYKSVRLCESRPRGDGTMEQKSVLDRFVDALRGVQPANLSYEEAERRAIPGESDVQVSEDDLERADDLVRLISKPRPVVIAPASNPFYVEEFWRAVAYALKRPFKVVMVEADEPYYLLGKADPENGTTTEGKFTYCARRGYVMVLGGEATPEEKKARRIPAGLDWLAGVTQDFTKCPTGWTADLGPEGLVAPVQDGPSFSIHPSAIIIPTWMI